VADWREEISSGNGISWNELALAETLKFGGQERTVATLQSRS
jgi:hypothetical protein